MTKRWRKDELKVLVGSKDVGIWVCERALKIIGGGQIVGYKN